MLYSFPGRAGMKPPTLHPLRSIITRFELFVKGTETKNREVPLFLRRAAWEASGRLKESPNAKSANAFSLSLRSRKILPKNLTATQKYAIIYGGREGHCPCGRSALAAAGKDS